MFCWHVVIPLYSSISCHFPLSFHYIIPSPIIFPLFPVYIYIYIPIVLPINISIVNHAISVFLWYSHDIPMIFSYKISVFIYIIITSVMYPPMISPSDIATGVNRHSPSSATPKAFPAAPPPAETLSHAESVKRPCATASVVIPGPTRENIENLRVISCSQGKWDLPQSYYGYLPRNPKIYWQFFMGKIEA